MNVSMINTAADAKRFFATEHEGMTPKEAESVRTQQGQQAAKQFEAIIIRQLLAPALQPLMEGGLAGEGGASGGGQMYGYLLTDTMANCLSQGGGLGLSKVLEQQLTPKSEAAAAKVASAYTNGKMNNHE